MVYYFPEDLAHFFMIATEHEKFFYENIQELGKLYPLIEGKSIIYAVTLDTPTEKIKPLEDVLNKYNFKRIWLVSAAWERDGREYPYVRRARQWFKKRYRMVVGKNFDEMHVELFERR